MDEILRFLANHLAVLWENAQFRITGSLVTTNNGGSSQLYAESSVVRLRFSFDRGDLLLALQPSIDADEWFSIDLVQRLLDVGGNRSALLSEESGRWIRVNLPEVSDRFSPERWPQTKEQLRRLRIQRRGEMFGDPLPGEER